MVYNEDFDIQLDKIYAKIEVKMSKKVVKKPEVLLKKRYWINHTWKKYQKMEEPPSDNRKNDPSEEDHGRKFLVQLFINIW